MRLWLYVSVSDICGMIVHKGDKVIIFHLYSITELNHDFCNLQEECPVKKENTVWVMMLKEFECIKSFLHEADQL